MPLEIVGQRQFSQDDQLRFARLSGDVNPMHMDAVAARRTMAGFAVVHGIHTLSWVLDGVLRTLPDLPPIVSLKVAFKRMVYVGDSVKAAITKSDDKRLTAAAIVDDTVAMTVDIRTGNQADRSATPAGDGAMLEPASPLVLTMSDIEKLSGHIPIRCDSELVSEMFPTATAVLGAQRMAALGRLSYLVGMVCPGLHSIFSGMNLVANSPVAAEQLDFRVSQADARFRRVTMAVSGGGWEGSVETFLRPEPQSQPPFSEIVRHVKPGEFAGARALVVGGSRGLGELTAKMLACGGAHVTITYAVGEADARRVQAEIADKGGHCDILAYDVRKIAADQLRALKVDPNQVYYMATPPIFAGGPALFDAARFQSFITFYVTGFHELCRYAKAKAGRELAVFYPSSISVEARPKGMTEYTMAKAAGEVLCADLQSFGDLEIVVERLPRLPTDQTATLFDVETADPIAVMLPILRKLPRGPERGPD